MSTTLISVTNIPIPHFSLATNSWKRSNIPMPLYKQVLLANRKSSPKQIANLFQECAKIITNNGGVIRSIENRGERRLGYAIEDRRYNGLQRHYEAKLLVAQFNTNADIIEQVDKKLRYSSSIIRYCTFRVRDPIDSLFSTRKSLEELRNELDKALGPSLKEKFEKEKQEMSKKYAEEIEANGFDEECGDEEDDSEDMETFEPEWKRDAFYEPPVPEHLENDDSRIDKE